MQISAFIEYLTLEPNGHARKLGQHHNLNKRFQKLYTQRVTHKRDSNVLDAFKLARAIREALNHETL